ncbi:MAG: DEAD/DEAH box helicase [Chloroflexi bacterium]|nr:DEAD/DEAH box helicase [Chloroflexota bacterium]
MNYQVGSLVRARGREWVVQPESSGDWLILRPLGGTDAEKAGIFLPLEGHDVAPAVFDPPDPTRPGDFISARLLRDAVRLGFRSSAGPFRSFAHLNVEPRPYQLVPLLMALKLDPVRLLIADDVGIGKTIEAGLIARELLDRGEVQRLAVLCPPYLAEQWQEELAEKFHINAELVLPSTVTRLERHTAVGQSLFDLYPFVVISTDYIKSSRRRDEFVRTCPELVIIDEAHTVAFNKDRRSGRHLRHRLASELAADPARHLLLTTATPHSGDEGAFRSLLALLRPDFANLPQELSGRENERHRREVANHLVQRRRADIRAYMETDTAFPEREETEVSYVLSNEYKKLFNTVLDYARERVTDESGSQQQQRVRWWSALALLRSLASSPAAAAATLRTRSGTAEAATVEEADTVGERSVLDLIDTDASEFLDVAPGGQEGDEQDESQRERLLRYARRAESLFGPQEDNKLATAIEVVKELLNDGFSPILFCRFIPTAEYVAAELRQALPGRVGVMAVTGTLPPAEREQRVKELGAYEQRVLVATDCLSEGVNLQDYFSAVMHYDLSWNPTRHEQREGRVDRFGQPQPLVRAVTYYGTDNQIDGIVLEVLLRKHKAIRSSLGISVPVPANSNDVVQALMQGLLLRGRDVDSRQLRFEFADDEAEQLYLDWENATAREKQSRTMFAQRAIHVDEVAREWQAMREAIGTGIDVERFVTLAVTAHGGYVEQKNGNLELHLPRKASFREAVLGVGSDRDLVTARFEMPVSGDVLYLSRTHPFVEGLAGYVMDAALDPLLEGVAQRCGAIRTRAVDQLTTLLLLRFRFHIEMQRGGEGGVPLLAEEAAVVGFTGLASEPYWLPEERAEQLLQVEPDANVHPQQATRFLERVVGELGDLQTELAAMAGRRAEELLADHERVRDATRMKGSNHSIRPQTPVDVLGVYVLLPA